MQKSKYQILKNNMMIVPISKSEQEKIKELSGRSPTFRVLCQIQAIQDIETINGVVKTGTLGGYVQSAYNLNPFDKSWIEPSSVVMQNAQITNDSYIGKNITCCWAFITPPNSHLDADHHIIVDHIYVYSTKHKSVAGRTGQDNAIQELLDKQEQMDSLGLQWQQAVPIVHSK